MKRIRFWTGVFLSDSGLERSCEAATGLPRGGPRASVDVELVEGCPNPTESLKFDDGDPVDGCPRQTEQSREFFFRRVLHC